MADVSASAGSTLIEKLFGSIEYPWRKRIEGDRLRAEEEEIEFEVRDVDTTDGDDLSADEPQYLNDWVETYVRATAQQRRDGEGEKALDELLSPYSDGEASAETILARLRDDPAGAENLKTFLNRLKLEFGVEWIEIELSTAPGSSLGNPIRLTNLRIAARLKAKACAKIFGKEVCIKITSPWVRFENQEARVALQVSGLRVYGLASVSNFDLVLKFKILGKKFEVRIGLTKYVNRFLAKSKPVLLDFSDMKIEVPGIDVEFKPITVAVPQDPATTSVEIDGRFDG